MPAEGFNRGSLQAVIDELRQAAYRINDALDQFESVANGITGWIGGANASYIGARTIWDREMAKIVNNGDGPVDRLPALVGNMGGALDNADLAGAQAIPR